jgi:hypothetical protein
MKPLSCLLLLAVGLCLSAAPPSLWAAAADVEGVVDEANDKAIALEDGKVIGVDAKTEYVRDTPKGPARAKASDVKPGLKVRAELDPKSKVATKVTIEEKKAK